MIENHQCGSSCEIQYCECKGSMYHGKHHGYSGACGCGSSHGGSSCGCGSSHGGSSCGSSHGGSSCGCGSSHGGSSCGCGINKGHRCGCGMSHGKHHGYSGACGCGMSYGGSSCGMSHGGSSSICGMNKGHGSSCGSGSADPMEQAKKLLQSAFFIALKEVHVEKIKRIIERNWGEKIDKAAELAVKEVEKHWPDSLPTSFTSKEFDNELREVLTSKDAEI